MSQSKQIVTIRGTRAGLTIVINDTCSYEAIKSDLKEKISANQFKDDHQLVRVKVILGHRYLNDEQKVELEEIISSQNNFVVDSFDSKVILKEEALRWKELSDVKTFQRIVRSGQVLQVVGDMLLIGDVNPGGKVEATGNIYVLGHLRGVAQAGSLGDDQAIIAASYMNPSQLRIADYISRAPDYESPGVYMEYAKIDQTINKIVIERIQQLLSKENRLSGLERRMENG